MIAFPDSQMCKDNQRRVNLKEYTSLFIVNKVHQNQCFLFMHAFKQKHTCDMCIHGKELERPLSIKENCKEQK